MITKLYAFVAKDNNGSEGIIAVRTMHGWLPLVAKTKTAVNYHRPTALTYARTHNETVMLTEFTARADKEIIYESSGGAADQQTDRPGNRNIVQNCRSNLTNCISIFKKRIT